MQGATGGNADSYIQQLLSNAQIGNPLTKKSFLATLSAKNVDLNKFHKSMFNINKEIVDFTKKEELFIQQMMNECKLKNLRLIMCSHYIPTKNIPDVGSFIIQKYDLYDYLGRDFDIKEPIIAWICGHVHKQQTIIINDIPIYINQDRVIVNNPSEYSLSLSNVYSTLYVCVPLNEPVVLPDTVPF